MTRNEFIETVNSWSSLIEFGRQVGHFVGVSVIPGNELQEKIAEDFLLFGDQYSWTEIREWLNCIEEHGEYYIRNSSFEYEDVTNSFDLYKRDVMQFVDEMECTWGIDLFEEQFDRNNEEEFSIDLLEFLSL